MIDFEGTYFDGETARARPVRVSTDGIVVLIRDPAGNEVRSVSLRDIEITPPLGRTRRSLKLPGGARCDTPDLDSAAALDRCKGGNRGMRLVHSLESRWKMAAGSLAALVLCVWAFLTFGIPFVAEKAAYSVPPELTETVSRRTLAVLDGKFLVPSELDSERTAEARQAFDRVRTDLGTDFRYRLEFRKSPHVGPNAFALPSGLIVVTDEMVLLVESERELIGVFAHEIAHVEKRHGLRSVFQNTGVFLLISALVGDVASITSTAAALPTLLAESGYSRKFEAEADEAAGAYFLSKGWSTQPLQDVLLRMTQDMPEFAGRALFSSHPDTAERVERLRALDESAAAR